MQWAGCRMLAFDLQVSAAGKARIWVHGAGRRVLARDLQVVAAPGARAGVHGARGCVLTLKVNVAAAMPAHGGANGAKGRRVAWRSVFLAATWEVGTQAVAGHACVAALHRTTGHSC